MTLKSTTTRAKLSTSSEDLAVQLGKINKWYDSLVPTGGASGNILGWNSDGTAKWVTVAPSANKLNVSSAVGGTTQPVYFKSDGTPESISFTIEKSVPSNAVFTDEKVKSTLLAQSTAAATYKPTFVTGAATGGVNIINSYQVAHTPGTTSAVGNTRLVLGNSTASGTANNEEGQIKLYSPGTALHTIKGATISSEAVHVLPSTGGTILNDGTTSYTQTVASSATGAYEIGKIKINGTTTTIYGKDTGTSYGISGAYGSNNNTWVTTITAGGTGTTSTVPPASTSAYGITKLYNGVDSTSTALAATANAVKTAYDKANHSHPYLPSTTTYAGSSTVGGAANSAVKLETARTINVDTGVTGTATSFDGSANITIPVTGIKEAYLTWGGKDFSASFSPLDAALEPRLGANRLEMCAGTGIKIERTTDGGTSWTEVTTSSISNTDRSALFSSVGHTVTVSATSTASMGTDAAKYMMRITLDTSVANVYSTLNKFILNISSGGASGSYVKLRVRTAANVTAGSDTWLTWDKTNKTWSSSPPEANTHCPIGGWSGFNVINTAGITTYGNTASQYRNIQFIFGCTKNDSASVGLAVINIQGYGGVAWNAPSNMARTGHLYSWTGTGAATFPSSVTANGNLIAYSASGDSPALILRRGTYVDNLNDWKIYVSSGHLYFDQSTANASSETWTHKMYYNTTNNNLYIGSSPVLHTDNTSFSQTLSSGTKIGTITIAGTATDIYTPSASTVNNASLTLKGAGTTVTTFTANASTNQSLDIVAGSNVTITPDATNHKITIASSYTNTDTKVNVTLGKTTQAYLLGTTTTPTTSAQAVTSIADTGVYLGSTAGSLYATTFYENGTALSSKYAALSHSHDELTSKTLTAATLDSTSGNFFFKGNSLFGGTDNFDWVGIQADASNDTFQLVAGGANGVFYRENDDVWGQWHSLLTNNMISGSAGITVTPNTITIGGEDGTTINSGVTISHSNSIAAETDTVFKKFSYDAHGHITGIANVDAGDIPDLNYVPKTQAGVNAAINLLSTGTSTPSLADYYVSQYANGGTTTTSYHRRSLSALWNAFKGLITLTTTGSGNAVTAVSIANDGDHNRKITVTKGSTFSLSTHNHDSDYVKTALSENYDINQPGYYAVMSNQNTENPDIDYELPTTNQWWHVLSMSYSGNSGDTTNWMSQLAIPTYQSKLRGLYWRTNSAANTALTGDDWKRVFCEERITSTATSTGTRNILNLWGQTVGNDASKLVSGVAGVLSYGDAGPQINFSTNSTIGAAQDSAIIWTDHDTAATGASWHFVSSQDDWNVISKRFHARTGISIGTDLPNKTYNLYVHGTAFHSESITFGTATSIVTGSAINIYTRATSTYSAAVKWSNGDTMGTRGAEIGYHNTGGDSTNPGTICILPYQTDSNPWDGEVGLFIKKDHVYIDGVELSKSDSHVTQTATTTNADYEVLFSATADNTTRTETARKNSNLKFNPSTGMLNAGRLTLTSSTWGGLIINRTASSSHAGIIFQQNGTELGAISMGEADSPLIRWAAGSSTSYKVYDEGHVQPMLWRYVPSGDPGSATDAGVYPAYTAAYMQGVGAFGGSTGRLGNSGSTYWAHYLTFTHNSSFRYILRFPFWGPPQFQHTNNDTDQKWSNFITDEHIGNYSRCMGTGTAIDPITGAMTHMHRGNKLAFLPAANITVQISNDSGSTWSNLSVTDTLKRQIFSLPGRSSGVKIGPTSGNATTAMQTRIIIECDGRDLVLNRFLFGISSDYHTIAIDVYAGSSVSGLTKIATGDASGSWAYEAVATIDNVPSKYYRFSTSNYKYFAFVFRYVTVDSSHLTNRGSVNSIAGYSGIFWGSSGKSNLANFDHMYSWDVDQNVDFPADVAGNSLSAPTVNVSTSSYKASVTASGLTQNRAITIGDVSGDVGIVKVLHDNANYAAGQTVAITTAEKFKYFIVTVRPNNTFGEKTEIIRITQDTSISTKYISFTGDIGPAPSQPTITLGGYITHQYNTTSKTYTIGAGHAANYILCNNNVSSVSADSITLAITKIVGLA